MYVILRVQVQGICSYLGGSATAEETEVAKKNLDSIDQELGASGHGLLDDREVHQLEDDLAVVYYQLGTAVRTLSLELTHAVIFSRAGNLADVFWRVLKTWALTCMVTAELNFKSTPL